MPTCSRCYFCYIIRRGAHQWNKLHETWNICMMQQINIFQWSISHYKTRNKCFSKYISWSLLIVLREEMLCNSRRCCHVFRQFKWKDYNKLREIYFLSVHWAANMLHAIMVFNHSEFLFLKFTFTNTFLRECKMSLRQHCACGIVFNHEFILHFFEQLFVNLSIKNENSPFVIENHDLFLAQ